MAESDVDIFSAAAFGEHETLRDLLARLRARGVPHPELERDAFGSTILIEASKLGFIEACRVSLDEGADIAATDAMGRAALHWAAGGGRLDIVDFLLSRGAAPDVADARGETPLRHASRGGYDRVTSRLIAAGASGGALDWVGTFPSRPGRSLALADTAMPPAPQTGVAPGGAASSVAGASASVSSGSGDCEGVAQ